MTAIQLTLLGQHLRIASPVWLWLAPAALLLGALAAYAAVARQAQVRGLAPDRRVLRGGGTVGGALRSALGGLGLCLLFGAAAGPQCGERAEVVKRSGVDLVIALDVSRSMLARDVKPSRLERAKLEVSALLDRLAGDRVALVVFAGDAFVQCPLTTDYSAARLFLSAVDPEAMPEQGTALAAALLTAKDVIERGSRGPAGAAVLLLSDGEDQEGEAEKAASALAEAGIRLYAVAIGGETGEPIPLFGPRGEPQGFKRDRAGRTVLSRANPAALAALAARGRGALLAGNGSDPGVLSILPELEKLQHGELESRVAVQYADRSPVLAWPGFLLLWLASLLGEGPLRLPRRRPE